MGLFATKKISLSPFRISAAGTVDSLVEKVTEYAIDAKSKGADLVLLPELVGFELLSSFQSKDKKTEIKQISKIFREKYISIFSGVAQANGIAIAGASVPYFKNDQVYNVGGFFTADGKHLLQEKLFLTPDEIKLDFQAGNELKPFNWDGINCVLLICLDVEVPKVSLALSQMDLDLILVPSMVHDSLGRARVSLCAGARAVENCSYVAAVGVESHCKYYEAFSLFMTPKIEPFNTNDSYSHLSQTNNNYIFNIDPEKIKLSLSLEKAIRPSHLSREHQSQIIVPPKQSFL